MLRKKIIIDLFENKVEIVFRKKKISRNVEITVVVSIQTATAALGVKSNFRIVFSSHNILCDENKDAEKQKNTRMWESGFVQNEQPGNGQMQL